MPNRRIDLPGVDLDFSDSIVEAVMASLIDLEVKLRGVRVPRRRLTKARVRFEGIDGFDQIWYQFNSKIRKRGRNEIHDPWPLQLPAPLMVLREVKSRRKKRQFQFSVDEGQCGNQRKPLEFACKRFCVTDLKGNLLAGDESKISRFRQWKEMDFLQIAELFASSIESREFEKAYRLFNLQLAKKTSFGRFQKQFDPLVKLPRSFTAIQNELEIATSFELQHLGGYDPDYVSRSIDPDGVVAIVQTAFVGRFICNLVLTEEDQELRICHYSIDRDWEMAFF